MKTLEDIQSETETPPLYGKKYFKYVISALVSYCF